MKNLLNGHSQNKVQETYLKHEELEWDDTKTLEELETIYLDVVENIVKEQELSDYKAKLSLYVYMFGFRQDKYYDQLIEEIQKLESIDKIKELIKTNLGVDPEEFSKKDYLSMFLQSFDKIKDLIQADPEDSVKLEYLELILQAFT